LFASLHTLFQLITCRFSYVPLSICRDINGFSYGSHGWHYMIAFLREYLKNREKALSEKSILNRFYEMYTPLPETSKSALEIMRLTIGSDQMFRKQSKQIPMPKLLHRNIEEEFKLNRHWFGPHSQVYINKEKQRLINLMKSLQSIGYRPIRYNADFVRGYYIAHKKKRIFLVIGGHHRCAILSVMGIKKICCRIQQSRKRCVGIGDAYQFVDTMELTNKELIDRWFFEMFSEYPGSFKPAIADLFPNYQAEDIYK